MLESDEYGKALVDWLKFAVTESLIVAMKCGFCASWVVMAWWLHTHIIGKFAVEAWIPWILITVFEVLFDLSTLRTICMFLFWPRKRVSAHVQWWQ